MVRRASARAGRASLSRGGAAAAAAGTISTSRRIPVVLPYGERPVRMRRRDTRSRGGARRGLSKQGRCAAGSCWLPPPPNTTQIEGPCDRVGRLQGRLHSKCEGRGAESGGRGERPGHGSLELQQEAAPGAAGLQRAGCGPGQDIGQSTVLGGVQGPAPSLSPFASVTDWMQRSAPLNRCILPKHNCTKTLRRVARLQPH